LGSSGGFRMCADEELCAVLMLVAGPGVA
jgi:hypothetical protein